MGLDLLFGALFIGGALFAVSRLKQSAKWKLETNAAVLESVAQANGMTPMGQRAFGPIEGFPVALDLMSGANAFARNEIRLEHADLGPLHIEHRMTDMTGNDVGDPDFVQVLVEPLTPQVRALLDEDTRGELRVWVTGSNEVSDGAVIARRSETFETHEDLQEALDHVVAIAQMLRPPKDTGGALLAIARTDSVENVALHAIKAAQVLVPERLDEALDTRWPRVKVAIDQAMGRLDPSVAGGLAVVEDVAGGLVLSEEEV